MRRALEWVGRALIASGALLVLFVVYQLWGTNLLQAADQRDLKSDFRQAVATAPPEPEATEPEATEPEPAPPPAVGEAVGILSIPAIGMEQALVEGAGRGELEKGPGHYPHSPLPGRSGNVSIAGHRTTYGAPFNRIDELAPGDEIVVETVEGTFTYEVAEQRIVAPDDVSVVTDTDDDRITLTTCNPKYSARERLVVVGSLRGDPVGSAAPDEAEAERGDVLLPPVDHLDGGSPSGLDAVRGGTALWTLLLLAVGGAWWAAGHWRRHWVSWFAPSLPFLLVLFFFFGEVERLLPAGY